MIHGTELTADHAQPPLVVTETVRKAEAEVSETAVADSEIAQIGAACVTEKMRPPIVSVAVRTAFVVFASSSYETAPLPVPLAPPVTVSHVADDVVDHEQEDPVVTETEPVAASAAADTAVGEIVMSHVPVWPMVTVRPATVSVPERGDVDVFGATVNVTAPLPPVFGPPPEVSMIHDALLVAVHRQPAGIVTETTPFAPAASTDWLVGDTVAVHEAAPWVIVSRRPAMAMVPVRPVPAVFGSTL